MTKTENFALNQWDAGDPIRREDFNADNVAIDAAIAAVPRVVSGTYTTDTTYVDPPYHVTVGFRPKVVFIWKNGYEDHGGEFLTAAAMVTDGAPFLYGSTTTALLEVDDTGFTVRCVKYNGLPISPALAKEGTSYYYIAVK